MYLQVMIIDPDLATAKELKYYLQQDNVRAYYSTSVMEGIRHLAHYCYHLVVIDVSSMNGGGLQDLKRIRALVPIPILALSADGTSDHIVQILSIADDFLQKPIDLGVCFAKIQALLRRSGTIDPPFNAPPILSSDDKLLVDPGRRKVILMDMEIPLPRKQFELLYLLAGNPGRVFTREVLYEKVWGEAYIGNDNTLNCQMRSLRSSLKTVPNAPDYIHTMRGVGYYFDIEQE